jgi:hypothetical protein
VAKSKQQAAALKHGWRSGLEEVVAEQLRSGGTAFLYEPFGIPYTQPEKLRKFTPDFVLPNGIVVETKGRFVTADRQKHLLLKAQYPDLDLRFVFSNSRARISKQSKTTYAVWCESKGFLYADKRIPQEWIDEPHNEASKSVLRKLREK